MLVFIVTDKGRPEAGPGAHDDLVMAAAIGWDVLRKPLSTRTEVSDHNEPNEAAWT